jgi:hypothetical protein
MSLRTTTLGGSALSPMDWTAPATWENNSVPDLGDDVLIPAGSFVQLANPSGTYGHPNITVNWYLALFGSYGNALTLAPGVVVVAGGGLLVMGYVDVGPWVIVEAGGTFECNFNMSTTSSFCLILAKANSVVVISNSTVYCLAESGSNVTTDGSVVAACLDAIVTGGSVSQSGVGYQSVSYTGNMSNVINIAGTDFENTGGATYASDLAAAAASQKATDSSALNTNRAGILKPADSTAADNIKTIFGVTGEAAAGSSGVFHVGS